MLEVTLPHSINETFRCELIANDIDLFFLCILLFMKFGGVTFLLKYSCYSVDFKDRKIDKGGWLYIVVNNSKFKSYELKDGLIIVEQVWWIWMDYYDMNDRAVLDFVITDMNSQVSNINHYAPFLCKQNGRNVLSQKLWYISSIMRDVI